MIQFLKMRRLVGLFLLGAISVLLLLLARNPYGLRTLIPNLEPYPDTLHYIVPARSLVGGGPFAVVREGRILRPSVPPLYSLFLAPFYLINGDPRTYYFANVLLALISVVLLWLILKKIEADKWIIGLALFVFVTNYYVSWYPQWAMAENLILPLFLGSIYLLIVPSSKKNILLASAIPALVYGTKYAYLPFVVVYLIFYALKIFSELKTKKVKNILTFVLFSGLFSIPVFLLQFYNQPANPLSRLVQFVVGILSGSSGSGSANLLIGPTAWFSKEFFIRNFPLYLKGLLGENTRFLWDSLPIWPKYIVFAGWLGLFVGLFKKRYRMLTLALLALLIFPLISIATFSTFDLRYVYHVIPTLVLGFVLFLIFIKEEMRNRKLGLIFILLIFSIASLYLFNNFSRLRYQMALNLKYAETPWYYISVLKLNDYYSDEKVGAKKPYVISPMPPYYIDFFSNGNYKLLPLSKDQEFRLYKEVAWGPEDYSDFHSIYKKYLRQGYAVYVSTYGLGNEGYLHLAFDNLSKDFSLVEVQNECYSQCKIYRLQLKNAKNI